MTRDHLIGPLALANYVTGVAVAAMGATAIVLDPDLDTAVGIGWLPWAAIAIGTIGSVLGWAILTTRRPDPFPPPQPAPPEWVNDGARR